MGDIKIDWTLPSNTYELDEPVDQWDAYAIIAERLGVDGYGATTQGGVNLYSAIQGSIEPFDVDPRRMAAYILARHFPEESRFRDVLERVNLQPLLTQIARALAAGNTINGKPVLDEGANTEDYANLVTPAVMSMLTEFDTNIAAMDEAQIRAINPQITDAALAQKLQDIKLMRVENTSLTPWHSQDGSTASAQAESARYVQRARVLPEQITLQDSMTGDVFTIDSSQLAQSQPKYISEDELRSLARATGADPFALVRQSMTGDTNMLRYEPLINMNVPGYPGLPGTPRFSLSQAVEWIYTQPVNSDALINIQKKLEGAGLLQFGEYRVGALDQQTVEAWRSLIGSAWTTNTEVMRYVDQLTEGRRQMMNQVASARTQTTLDQFGFDANGLAQQVIGRELTAQEVTKLREQFIQFDQQNYLNSVQSKTSYSWTSQDQNAWIANRIRQANVLEAQKMEDFTSETQLTLAATGRSSLKLPTMTEQERRDVVTFAAKQGWTPERMIAHIFDVYGGR